MALKTLKIRTCFMWQQKIQYMFFLLCVISYQPILGQSVEQDSLSLAMGSEQTYYQIKILRLNRWLRENVDNLHDMALLKEIVKLKREAESFSEVGDYEMANIWLETILELLQPEQVSSLPAHGGRVATLAEDEILGGMNEKKFSWSREISTGMDFWRHEFNFGFFQQDSTFLEGSGNPSTSVRVNFDYGSSFGNSIRGTAFFKYSRDYIAGEGDIKLDYHLTKRSFWQLKERFEVNSFYRDFDLKYWQNTGTIAFKIRESRKISFDIEEEFGIRRYVGEDSTYANYLDNRLKLFGRLYFGIGTFLGIGYRNHQRLHPSYDVKDYGEHRFQSSFSHSTGARFSLSLDNEVRVRAYTNAPVDTTFQDYWEDYLYGELTLGFSNSFGVDIKGSFTQREYDFFNTSSLPDYTFWEINPEFYLKFANDWKVSAGLYYAQQSHENLLTRTSRDDLSTFSIFFEDYFRYGPTVTLELFQTDGILLTVKESYLLERYPDSETDSIEDFNLFSDRNINSLLLFFNWKVSNQWQLHVFANMDDDRSRKDDSGDSRNTLLGMEISYDF